MNTNYNKRIEWVDISKGIGIILVIIGHCVYFGGAIHNWIFSFHMPLFFILSGFFIKKTNISLFIKKKFQTLLLPYLIFWVIGILVTLIIPYWRNKITFKGFVADLYLSSPDNVNVSSIWFLVALFISSILFQLCLKTNKAAPFFVLAIASSGFVLGYCKNITAIMPAGRIPFGTDVAMVALLFVAIGYYSKNAILNLLDFLEKRIILKICLLISFCVLSIYLVRLNGTVNIHSLIFNNLFLYIIEALTGTFIIIMMSSMMSSTKLLSKSFVWLGQNSLKILGAQAIHVRLYITIVKYIIGIEYKLYFLPKRHAIISSVIVILLSVFSVWIFNYLYREIKLILLSKCKKEE